MNINLQFARVEKRALLLTLYDYLEETFKQFPLACKPGCNLCCTSKLYATSVEAEYLFEGLDEAKLKKIRDFTLYPRPRRTHNELALLYFKGEEPQEEGEEFLEGCPLLSEEGLCTIYEKRPLICRILTSFKTCTPEEPAQITTDLYLMGLISLQIAENIDLGGLYGNLFDLLKFWESYHRDNQLEIPPYLLTPITFEELPLLPEEKTLRTWVGNLYRKEVTEGLTFRELLDNLQKAFKTERSLSFLDEIWEE